MTGRKTRKSYTSDRKMIQLIKVLKKAGTIKFNTDFCEAVGINKQNLYNVSIGINHFTPEQIENAVIAYNVNANWIFGTSDDIFTGNKKRHIDEINN